MGRRRFKKHKLAPHVQVTKDSPPRLIYPSGYQGETEGTPGRKWAAVSQLQVSAVSDAATHLTVHKQRQRQDLKSEEQ